MESVTVMYSWRFSYWLEIQCPGESVLGERMLKSQRNSGINHKPRQLELAKESPRQVSKEGLSGASKPDAILVEPEGSG